MRKAHPYGVQGRRPIASKYKRALKEKNSVYKSHAIQCIAFIF